MRLDAVQPGVGVDEVVANTGFELLVPRTVPELEPPTGQELAALARLRGGDGAVPPAVPEEVAAG